MLFKEEGCVQKVSFPKEAGLNTIEDYIVVLPLNFEQNVYHISYYSFIHNAF